MRAYTVFVYSGAYNVTSRISTCTCNKDITLLCPYLHIWHSCSLCQVFSTVCVYHLYWSGVLLRNSSSSGVFSLPSGLFRWGYLPNLSMTSCEEERYYYYYYYLLALIIIFSSALPSSMRMSSIQTKRTRQYFPPPYSFTVPPPRKTRITFKVISCCHINFLVVSFKSTEMLYLVSCCKLQYCLGIFCMICTLEVFHQLGC